MTNSPFTTIALILLMVVAFYFLIIRPQKKRQQAQQKTMSELTPGTRVLLGSGLFGTISWVGQQAGHPRGRPWCRDDRPEAGHCPGRHSR